MNLIASPGLFAREPLKGTVYRMGGVDNASECVTGPRCSANTLI